MSQTVEDTLQERNIGRYNLVASLGQGGMADVYLAVIAGPASFNKLVVIKALKQDVHANAEFVQMFLDEARLSARFNHPNIVQSYEVGETQGRYFIAMEYLDGQTLRSVQRKLAGSLPLEEELRVIAEIARGLHYVHEMRDFNGAPLCVVHRDVSPQNVFLTYDGQVKLLDFGIAKAIDSEHLTQVGLVKGKVDYVAPEQALGDPLDRRADIFSLGAMAWEAVTRQRFAGGHKISAATKLHKRLSGGEPDVLDVQPETPERLARLIRRAIALDPARRFDTALALAAEIDEFLDAMNLRPSATTLGERLARPFAADRARISAVIEHEVKRLSDTGPRASSMPSLDRSDLTQTRSGISGSGAGRALGAGESAPSAQRRGWLRAHGPKIAVIGAAVSLAVLVALREERPAQTPVASSSVATTAEPRDEAPRVDPPHDDPPPAEEPSRVEIALQVSPVHASANLDGVGLAQLPFHAQLERDGQMHHIEVSAAGYVSKKVAVAFDRNQNLLVSLEREPAAAADVPIAKTAGQGKPLLASRREPGVQRESLPSSSVAPALSQPSEVMPGAALVSKRRAGVHIDKHNPYAD